MTTWDGVVDTTDATPTTHLTNTWSGTLCGVAFSPTDGLWLRIGLAYPVDPDLRGVVEGIYTGVCTPCAEAAIAHEERVKIA